ncbi:DNA primase family protein [Ralstonia mannitolilytica]|uniref:DNA primase family protein n=2 Tax=Ralstonia mannitolilytica TaxID=105219 RepID=UPI003B83B598
MQDRPEIRLPLVSVDADHMAVGIDNARKVVDLRTGQARPAAPCDYVTKSLNVAEVGSAEKAVRWKTFLEQVFQGDLEMIDWIQRFCGYLLTGSTQEQFFLFCYGHGANGKSVFIETLKYIMGDYSRAIASETLAATKRQAGAATPDLVPLVGVRLAMCTETEDNTSMAESLVKSLVSGDSMAVRQNYGSSFQFTPILKLVMVGNHQPRINGTDQGIWRRVRLVPFNQTFAPDKRDPQLLTKLKEEAPHILAWMLDGCKEWQRRELQDIPKAIQEATDAYREDQDVLGSWLSECTEESSVETAFADLYASYKAWCIDNGLMAASAKVLGRRLKERRYEPRKSNGKMLYSLALTDRRHLGFSAPSTGSGVQTSYGLRF